MLATKTREALKRLVSLRTICSNYDVKFWTKAWLANVAQGISSFSHLVIPIKSKQWTHSWTPPPLTTSGQAWFCTTGITRLVIEIEVVTFHLRKVFFFPINPWIFFFSSIQYNILSFSFLIFQFPLMSESRKLRDLRTEQETNTSTVQPRTTEEEQENSDGYEIEENSVT